MPWIPLAIALMQFLAPFLKALFDKWLNRRLKEVAMQMEAEGVKASGSPTEMKLQLLDRVESELWWFQFGKKRAVQQCREVLLSGKAPATLIG